MSPAPSVVKIGSSDDQARQGRNPESGQVPGGPTVRGARSTLRRRRDDEQTRAPTAPQPIQRVSFGTARPGAEVALSGAKGKLYFKISSSSALFGKSTKTLGCNLDWMYSGIS